jgi:hypothetical protein
MCSSGALAFWQSKLGSAASACGVLLANATIRAANVEVSRE